MDEKSRPNLKLPSLLQLSRMRTREWNNLVQRRSKFGGRTAGFVRLVSRYDPIVGFIIRPILYDRICDSVWSEGETQVGKQ